MTIRIASLLVVSCHKTSSKDSAKHLYIRLLENQIKMSKVILSINAGSSSVKVSVFKGSSKDAEPTQLAEASVAGLTAPPSTLSYKRGDKKIKDEEIKDVSSQEDAFKYILEQLMNDDGLPELKNKEDIEFACHRVVHGGDFDKPTRIDRETYHHIEELSDLAPL
jgi:acetate kinase